MKFSFDTNC